MKLSHYILIAVLCAGAVPASAEGSVSFAPAARQELSLLTPVRPSYTPSDVSKIDNTCSVTCEKGSETVSCPDDIRCECHCSQGEPVCVCLR